jgi:hypothetical protein
MSYEVDLNVKGRRCVICSKKADWVYIVPGFYHISIDQTLCHSHMRVAKRIGWYALKRSWSDAVNRERI